MQWLPRARWLMLLLVAVAGGTQAAPTRTGLQADVRFDSMPAFARNGALLRRLQSPLEALHTRQALAGRRGALEASPIDPDAARFALYVPPPPAPAGGYALLVFVPPWNPARVPESWLPALDRSHTILVTAAGSGNAADVANRREPLALLGAHGVMQRYRVNPAQVYVGGFSGGSRVALRLALGYPDLFRGALLDAGSDPIGTAAVPLPPAKLLHQFQDTSRLVFLTGEDDVVRQAQLARASASLQHWCAFNTRSITLLRTPHVLADAAAVTRALAWLQRPAAPPAARVQACRARVHAQLDARVTQVRAFMAAGRVNQAARTLARVDAVYGGLAAPASVEILQRIQAKRPLAGRPPEGSGP